MMDEVHIYSTKETIRMGNQLIIKAFSSTPIYENLGVQSQTAWGNVSTYRSAGSREVTDVFFVKEGVLVLFLKTLAVSGDKRGKKTTFNFQVVSCDGKLKEIKLVIPNERHVRALIALVCEIIADIYPSAV